MKFFKNKKENELQEEPVNNKETPVEEKTLSNPQKSKKKISYIIYNILTPLLLVFAVALAFNTGMLYRDLIHKNEEMSDYEYVLNLLEKEYNFTDYDEKVAAHNAINAYLASLGDKYAYYLSPEQHEDKQMQKNGEKVILGIVFEVTDNMLYVAELTEGAPAESAGIKIGDKLVSINGVKIRDVNAYNEFFSVETFKDNQEVAVVVERDKKEIEYKIVAKKTSFELCTSRMIDKILYIKLSTFSNKSANELKEVIKNISPDCEGIVLDLRNNGGGELTALEKIAGHFIGDKMIAEFRYKNDTEKCLAAKTDITTDLPLTVLVNKKSASASECLTGALQCYGRATIVGTTTFGKGIGQSTYLCPNGGYVTFTSSKYYLPNGECIHEIGITPDIEVELPEEVLNGSEKLTDKNDTQLQTALTELTKK